MGTQLAGKRALVTGSSKGIGAAVARRLAEDGADVVVNHNTDTAGGERVAESIRSLGRRSRAIAADVGNSAQARALVASAADFLGGLDILVNNAGITKDTLFLTMEDADWDAVINGNLKSVFLFTRAAAKHMMRGRWGRIINLGSVVGLHGNKGQANYAASKAGIVGFTKSVARELAGRNITANVVAPGFIATDMTGVLPDVVKKAVLDSVPLKRMGDAADIANAAAFLAGDEAGYITGVVLQVDGGMSM